MTDSQTYIDRKSYFNNLLTIYGRKPVLEVFQTPDIQPMRLHLADSNQSGGIINEILALANQKNTEIHYHNRKALSRISKNGKQDQGVAVDIEAAKYQSIENLDIAELSPDGDQLVELIALDRITNPQNLGMIIRSVAASPCHGLLIPRTGCARLDSLVIKASAGTLFRARIYHCDTIESGIDYLKKAGFEVLGLAANGTKSLSEIARTGRHVYILGNETNGMSEQVQNSCDKIVSIPLANDVESLNVSVAASIVSFRTLC
jgi:23S rRNA (guanosine2251-2'-O)-methyltransferase